MIDAVSEIKCGGAEGYELERFPIERIQLGDEEVRRFMSDDIGMSVDEKQKIIDKLHRERSQW